MEFLPQKVMLSNNFLNLFCSRRLLCHYLSSYHFIVLQSIIVAVGKFCSWSLNNVVNCSGLSYTVTVKDTSGWKRNWFESGTEWMTKELHYQHVQINSSSLSVLSLVDTQYPSIVLPKRHMFSKLQSAQDVSLRGFCLDSFNGNSINGVPYCPVYVLCKFYCMVINSFELMMHYLD